VIDINQNYFADPTVPNFIEVQPVVSDMKHANEEPVE
jgi:hypothetical protein